MCSTKLSNEYHISHQLVDTGLDPLVLVQQALPLRPPNVVPLNVVDLFREVHPFVLRFGRALLAVELPDEARVRGDAGLDRTEDLPHLIHRNLSQSAANPRKMRCVDIHAGKLLYT